MKVNLILASNLNHKKLESNESLKSQANGRQNAVSNTCASNIYMHPVQFGNNKGLIQKRPFLDILSNFYGIISPYNGKPMFPSYVLNGLKNQIARNTPLDSTKSIIRVVSEPKNMQGLNKVNAVVFNRIKQCSLQNPKMDLFEIMRELRKESIGRLLVRELRVLNNIDMLSKNLSKNTNVDVRALTSTTRDILNGGEEDVFRRKIFIKKLNEIISQNPNENDEIFSIMQEKAKALPTSSTNTDAFIVKYSRPIDFKDDGPQIALFSQIDDIDNRIRNSIRKKDYLKIQPILISLKESVKTNQNYSEARKNLINQIQIIDNSKGSIEQRKALTQKIRSLPKDFTYSEKDLKLRMQATVSRLVGDSTMSAEHLIAQEDFKTLIDLNPIIKNKLIKERDSQKNLILADKSSNNYRSNQVFHEFIQSDPKIISEYFPAYFRSIFNLIEDGKISKAYLPDLEEQIQSVEDLSNGLIHIKNPYATVKPIEQAKTLIQVTPLGHAKPERNSELELAFAE